MSGQGQGQTQANGGPTESTPGCGHQPLLPDPPLNGPTTRPVIHPP